MNAHLAALLNAGKIAMALAGAAVMALQSQAAADKCYEFGVRQYPATENFYAVTGDAAVLQAIAAQLRLPEKERNMFPSGPIDSGNGGFNGKWHWHLVAGKWSLAEVATEVCDSWPTYIEEHRTAWIVSPKTFCPWGGFVLRECAQAALRPPASRPARRDRVRAAFVDGNFILDGTEITPIGRREPR